MTTEISGSCAQCGTVLEMDQFIVFGNDRVCVGCKDIFVQAIKEGVSSSKASAELRSIREEHLKLEGIIKSMGLLLYLVGGWMIISVVPPMLIGGPRGGTIISAIVFPVIFGLMIVVGRGLRTFNRFARIPATIIAVLGLLSFPVGTVISISFLIRLFSGKGQMVFTEEYAAIRKATPDMKPPSSILVTIILAVLAVLSFSVIPFFGIFLFR